MNDKPEFTIDWPHGWVTRAGRKVRILCTDAKSACPIIGLAESFDDAERHMSWFKNGRYSAEAECGDDLINAPEPRRTVWVNWYAGDGRYHVYGHESKERADAVDDASQRFACVEIEIPEHGTGLVPYTGKSPPLDIVDD